MGGLCLSERFRQGLRPGPPLFTSEVNMIDAIEAVLVTAVFLALTAVPCQADEPKVKYCKDARTGQIIVIEDGYPCPFPTHEL